MKLLTGALVVASLTGCVCAPPNTLSDSEKRDGWELLWDGQTTDGWVGVKDGCKTFPKASWVITNGVLTVYPVKGTEAKPWTKAPTAEVWAQAGGDIVTTRKFKDFAFKVDFRLTPAANSGIKYFYDENQNNGTTLEYQMLDKGPADWNKGFTTCCRRMPIPTSSPSANGIRRWSSRKERMSSTGSTARKCLSTIAAERRSWTRSSSRSMPMTGASSTRTASGA